MVLFEMDFGNLADYLGIYNTIKFGENFCLALAYVLLVTSLSDSSIFVQLSFLLQYIFQYQLICSVT